MKVKAEGERMNLDAWKIIAASIAGTSHVAADLPCQDFFVHEIIEGNLVVAVSDGAGSAADGGEGARLVCQFFVDGLRNFYENGGVLKELNRDFALGFCKIWRQKLADFAAERGQDLADFACTLLGAVIEPEAACFFQIGDGGIVYVADDEYNLFVTPQQGEYANSTHFVTDATALNVLEFDCIEIRIEKLAMFTDGLQRIVLNFDTKTPHVPFFRPMFSPLRAETISPELEKRLIDFLDSKTINNRTDDDKTLILAARNLAVLDF